MANQNYYCKILESNGEFDAYERVMCKDLGDAIPLDEATAQEPAAASISRSTGEQAKITRARTSSLAL